MEVEFKLSHVIGKDLECNRPVHIRPTLREDLMPSYTDTLVPSLGLEQASLISEVLVQDRANSHGAIYMRNLEW